jgi:hypothetical protein
VVRYEHAEGGGGSGRASEPVSSGLARPSVVLTRWSFAPGEQIVASMQSLHYIEAGTLAFREVPEPSLRGDLEALVRPVAASVCDIDRPLLQGTSPWKGPFAFGHEAVGEVVDVGDRVKSVRPGDLVAVAWHINCGVCDRCARGLTAHCRAVPPQAMYGLPVGGDFGGLFRRSRPRPLCGRYAAHRAGRHRVRRRRVRWR